MNLLISANGFDEVSQLAEMSQYRKAANSKSQINPKNQI